MFKIIMSVFRAQCSLMKTASKFPWADDLKPQRNVHLVTVTLPCHQSGYLKNVISLEEKELSCVYII